MFSSKERFADLFLKRLEMTCGKSFKDSATLDQYKTLGNMVREYISADWIETNEKSRSNSGKQTYYLSIEFLLGQLLEQNLMNLGVRDVVEAGLKENRHQFRGDPSDRERCRSRQWRTWALYRLLFRFACFVEPAWARHGHTL